MSSPIHEHRHKADDAASADDRACPISPVQRADATHKNGRQANQKCKNLTEAPFIEISPHSLGVEAVPVRLLSFGHLHNAVREAWMNALIALELCRWGDRARVVLHAELDC